MGDQQFFVRIYSHYVSKTEATLFNYWLFLYKYKLPQALIWVPCFQLSLLYLTHLHSHCIPCRETYFSVHMMF